MKLVSGLVRKFFEDYERSMQTANSELLAGQYGDAFIFAGPQGVQAIPKDDFLKALPQREGFFKAIGLASSTIQTLEETQLDDNYVMVKTDWKLRFEKDAGRSIVDEISATYVLYRQADRLRIVFQLDHQDLLKRVQALGLVPAKG